MRRLPLFIFALAVLAMAASGCSLAFSSFEGTVTGEAQPPVLLFHNDTNARIYYYIGETYDLAHTFLAPFDPADMPSVPAGATREIPYEEIAFYDEGDHRAWVAWMTRDEAVYETFTVDLP